MLRRMDGKNRRRPRSVLLRGLRLLIRCGVQGAQARLLNHSHFPVGRAHGFAALANIGVPGTNRARALYLLTPPGSFALRATAHRAGASLRCAAGRFGPLAQQSRLLNHSHFPTGRAHGFAALANIGVPGTDRARHLYLLTPPGRFALRATAHWADASLRCARCRLGPAVLVGVRMFRACGARPMLCR